MAARNLTVNKHRSDEKNLILVVTYLSNNHFLHVQSVLVLYTLVLNLKVAAVVINLIIKILVPLTLAMLIIVPT